MPLLKDVLALLDGWYPPHTADAWDAVGLVCGDPEAEVRRILLAVDPVAAVAQEAVGSKADLLVVHHPLFLKGVHGVAATTPKGRVVHELMGAGCALLAAHTNADAPSDGVSESLARTLGVLDPRPLEAHHQAPLDKIAVFAPVDSESSLRSVLADAGAGAIGDYEHASFTSQGLGRFRPLPGASPTLGEVGSFETVPEVRIEAVMRRDLRDSVVAAMIAAHPYEEPAYDILELAVLEDRTSGSGRIGKLATTISLAEFADLVAERLPQTAHGVRVSGDPARPIETVALCGGSGDFLLDRARAEGADVYLTSDLRHHPASEFREYDGPALVDVAHWAAEWTWLPVLRRKLDEALGDTVETLVSTTNTDPWSFAVGRAPS